MAMIPDSVLHRSVPYTLLVSCNANSTYSFTCCPQMMALIADFMLVWLPAPTLSFAGKQSAASQGRLQRFMGSCPDNAFQVR